MSFITDIMPKRPVHALGGLTAGAALHSGIGSLQGMIVSLGAPAGALFGGATYLAEQLTRPIFDSMIEKCQEECETYGQFLSKTLTVVSWIVPRLAGLAALAACGIAFGTWQAIALVVMNTALPAIAVFGLVILGRLLGENSCIGKPFCAVGRALGFGLGTFGAPPLINEELGGSRFLNSVFLGDRYDIFGPYQEPISDLQEAVYAAVDHPEDGDL